ncbi:hypothetical protein [Streptomyces sp. NBC_01408]|uniref:gasdermin n=1 Tax=Streptomyces sp. NBC_01408 TaxID=2903855 RepID=UPI00224DC555|nr:hypothetical protein [Streptomyces sp. NBC_01408]MCX4696484.1 hypothetical protein [Streptomyces sp. NBC_01408]
MVFCSDRGLKYLAGLGYNAVRHPDAKLSPLAVMGIRDHSGVWLGQLSDLVTGSQALSPTVQRGIAAADISGQSSSKISFKIGLEVLGSFVGAMGGTLGVSAGYTNAQTMQFVFRDVAKNRVSPAQVSQYIDAGDVVTEDPLFRPYFEGNGRLYIIVEVATSNSFTVRYERKDETAARVDLPVLQELVSGAVDISAARGFGHEVTYNGKVPLSFAFKCFEFGLPYGRPTLMDVKAGGVELSVSDVLSDDGEAPAGFGSILTSQANPSLLDVDWRGE